MDIKLNQRERDLLTAVAKGKELYTVAGHFYLNGEKIPYSVPGRLMNLKLLRHSYSEKATTFEPGRKFYMLTETGKEFLTDNY